MAYHENSLRRAPTVPPKRMVKNARRRAPVALDGHAERSRGTILWDPAHPFGIVALILEGSDDDHQPGSTDKRPDTTSPTGFDRWLDRQLHDLYDPVLKEDIPPEIADLLDRFDRDQVREREGREDDASEAPTSDDEGA